jgi:hypothetical protein
MLQRAAKLASGNFGERKKELKIYTKQLARNCLRLWRHTTRNFCSFLLAPRSRHVRKSPLAISQFLWWQCSVCCAAGLWRSSETEGRQTILLVLCSCHFTPLLIPCLHVSSLCSCHFTPPPIPCLLSLLCFLDRNNWPSVSFFVFPIEFSVSIILEIGRILKWICRKRSVVSCTAFNWLKTEPSGDSTRSSNEAPGPNKRGAFLDQLSNKSATHRQRILETSFFILLM